MQARTHERARAAEKARSTLFDFLFGAQKKRASRNRNTRLFGPWRGPPWDGAKRKRGQVRHFTRHTSLFPGVTCCVPFSSAVSLLSESAGSGSLFYWSGGGMGARDSGTLKFGFVLPLLFVTRVRQMVYAVIVLRLLAIAGVIRCLRHGTHSPPTAGAHQVHPPRSPPPFMLVARGDVPTIL